MSLLSACTAYYKFDANSNDSVGSNHGTDTNTPTYTAGKISNALTLAAASSQYTSVPKAILTYASNTYTINLWAKMTNTANNNGFVMNYNGVGSLLVYCSGNVVTNSKGGVVDLNYTWTGHDTNWHMWTFVGDGSGMRIYLDGNSTPVATNANTSNILDPGSTLPIGAYKNAGSLQAGWYLDGQIDEVYFSNTALTTTEIAELYASGSGLTYPFSGGAAVNSNFLSLMTA